MMKIYDISMKIFCEMPVYKGKESKRPIIKVASDFTSGTVYETKLEMNMHTGTHVDRSLHLLQGGSTIETLDLSKVITKCKVFDFKDVEERITKEQLSKKSIDRNDFIILKTKNSFEDILEGEFIYLDKTGAEYLRSKNIKGVGIDALGIERNQPEHETHKILLGAGIVILEGLRLKDVEEGEYLLAAAPINVVGCEAAPVRAVLIEQGD
jgi:arylformamidase